MKVHQVLMASATICGLLGTVPAYAAGRTETHECTLKYKVNETAVPMKEFNECVAKIVNRKDDVEFFHLSASTQLKGVYKTLVKNADLRLENLRKLLSADFPKARIDMLNVGPNARLGNTIRLKSVVAIPEKAAVMEEGSSPVTTEERPLHTTAGAGKESGDVQIEESRQQPQAAELPRVSLEPTVKAEGVRENFGRVAARLGQDADRDSDESFPAIGLEAAYVRPNTAVQNLRTEIGGTAVSMSKGSELMKRASAHVVLGAGYNISGVVLGARALGGGVWDSERKWRDDYGGEGRLGFENKTVSIFAGVGRTQKTSRFGLDVGLML